MSSTTSSIQPGLTAPPGVTPDFADPPSQGYITITIVVIYLLLTTPLVAIRMWTRCFIKGPVKWDDWTMVIGWVGLVGLCAISLFALRYGAGIDEWDVPKTNVQAYSKLWEDFQIVARVSILFVKLSILFMFLRIFNPPGTPKKAFYWWTVGTAWFNVLYAIAILPILVLQCQGGQNPATTHCISDYVSLILGSITNTLTDIIMLIIPIGGVWKLHMRTRQKIGISAIFAVGSLALVSAVASLAFKVAEANNPDQTHNLNIVALLAMAEQVAGVIVGCMPIMPAFFRHVFFNARGPGSASHASSSKKNTKLRYANYSISSGYGSREGGKRKTGSQDPYRLTPTLTSNAYEELDDLEGGRDYGARNGASVTAGHGNPFESSFSAGAEGLEIPDNVAVVSTSFRVESRPR